MSFDDAHTDKPHPIVPDKPPAATRAENWQADLLKDTRSLLHSLWAGHTPETTQVQDVQSLSVAGLFQDESLAASALRPGTETVRRNDLTTAAAADAMAWLTSTVAPERGSERQRQRQRIRPEIHTTENAVTADGRTHSGHRFHAQVDRRQGRAHIAVEGGPRIDADLTQHTVDYRSPENGEWTGHIANGVGEIRNANGDTISYDGRRFVAHDGQGNLLAESCNPGQLVMRLRHLNVHVGEHVTHAQACQERHRQAESNSDETRIFQDDRGDTALVNRDLIIRTNREHGYVEVTDSDDNSIRVRRQADGRLHFYQRVGEQGQEQELTPAELRRLSDHSGINFQDYSVSFAGRQLIDGQLNLHPTRESTVDAQTGQLSGRDHQGQEVQVSFNHQARHFHVRTHLFDWHSDGGFHLVGRDGSSVDIDTHGFHIREASGPQSNLNFTGTFTMNDDNNLALFSLDDQGSYHFSDGTEVNEAGDVQEHNQEQQNQEEERATEECEHIESYYEERSEEDQILRAEIAIADEIAGDFSISDDEARFLVDQVSARNHFELAETDAAGHAEHFASPFFAGQTAVENALSARLASRASRRRGQDRRQNSGLRADPQGGGETGNDRQPDRLDDTDAETIV